MPIYSKTNLGLLMKKLHISGNELAKAVYVNYSLVSKWKTGKRKLLPGTEHLKKVAAFLLEADGRGGNGIIKKLLSFYYDESSLASVEDVNATLCTFLCASYQFNDNLEPSYPAPSLNGALYYTSLCRVYRTNAGLRDAALHFLEQAVEMPPGQEILLLNQMDVSWLSEDPEFLLVWNHAFQRVLQAGHKLKMIHWMDNQTDKLARIVASWLPLNFIEGIEAWYYPQYIESPINSILMVIRDHFAVASTSPSRLLSDTVSFFHNDAAVASYYGDVFDSVLKDCKPLTDIFDNGANNKLITKLQASLNPSEFLFMMLDSPPILMLDRKDLQDILQANEIDEQSISICMDHFARLQMLNKDGQRLCLSLGREIPECKPEKYFSSELSALLGTPVYLSPDQRKRLYTSLIAALDNNAGQENIALIDEEIFGIPANILVQQNTILSACPREQSFKSVSATESTVVNALLHECNRLWHEIPRANKSPSYIKQRLISTMA